MDMVEDDGVYHSEQRRLRRRVQRRKKFAVGVAGLAALVAGAGYGVSAWQTARESTFVADAPGPVVTSTSRSSPKPAVVPTPAPQTSFRAKLPRLSAARQRTSPSPTPSPTTPPVRDEDVASAQISSLLRAPRTRPSGGVAAAGESIAVANERGPDGSTIRIVSARYDLTGRGARLWATDGGVPVGNARCTRNVRADGRSAAETRPGLLLCWRVTPDRSVVTVATRTGGSPAPVSSARLIERVWQRLA
ncbi:hypothetical protein [Actinoplanes sp. NPDC048796]|uniref:hypothetical protein n=1 Tax=Actinoplanes sp. NPDC048796 TaxID=3155640 RepID=UPI00340AC965